MFQIWVNDLCLFCTVKNGLRFDIDFCPSLAIGQSLQQGDDCVLFGWEQLQGRRNPAEGLCHPHFPPLTSFLSGFCPTASHPISVGLLLVPLENLLEQHGVGLPVILFLHLSRSDGGRRCSEDSRREARARYWKRRRDAQRIWCVVKGIHSRGEGWNFAPNIAGRVELCVAGPAERRGNRNRVCKSGPRNGGRRWRDSGRGSCGCHDITAEDHQGLYFRRVCWVHQGNSSSGADSEAAAGPLIAWLQKTSRGELPVMADECGGLWRLWFHGTLYQYSRQGRGRNSTFVSFDFDDLGADCVAESGIHQL